MPRSHSPPSTASPAIPNSKPAVCEAGPRSNSQRFPHPSPPQVRPSKHAPEVAPSMYSAAETIPTRRDTCPRYPICPIIDNPQAVPDFATPHRRASAQGKMLSHSQMHLRRSNGPAGNAGDSQSTQMVILPAQQQDHHFSTMGVDPTHGLSRIPPLPQTLLLLQVQVMHIGMSAPGTTPA